MCTQSPGTKFSTIKLSKKGTWDVASSIARPDHRKSKFGLRHRTAV
jgi:hypothetical protein